MAGEAQRVDLQSYLQDQVASAPPARVEAGSLNALLPAVLAAPGVLAPPQTQVEGPLVLTEHMAPPAPCLDDPAHPTYCVYTVEPGDTLSGIAQRFQLRGNESLSAVEMLAQSNKPDVVSSDEILPGQKLRLPKQTGIVFTVLSAKTLSEIAGAFGVTVEAIVSVSENGLSDGDELLVGQELLVPSPNQLPPVSTPQVLPTVAPSDDDEPDTAEPPPIETSEPEETPEPTSTPQPTATPQPDEEDEDEPTPRPTRTPRAGSSPTPTPTPRADRPTGASRYGFIWPVWGPISSYFGPRHPLGIDIDLFEDPNAPIAAAKAGIVTFAGGNACCSYGLYVIVDHGDGTSTLYAHLSQITVVQGQMVTQGQLLGYGGSTGYATGNHLHFEIRIGDDPVDPLLFLP